MTRISGSDPGRVKGFTLLEIMLVLGILAMAALLIAPGLNTLDSPGFNAQVREASGLLNYARRIAVVNGQPATVVFYTDQPDSESEHDDVQGLSGQWVSRGLELAYRESTGQRRRVDERLAIVFYPEGGSTGGDLQFSQGNRQATISVDPFSGRVKVQRDD